MTLARGKSFTGSDPAERLFGGSKKTIEDASARRSFRRPRTIFGNESGTHAQRRRRELRGSPQGRERPGILGERKFEVVEFQGRRVVLAGIADVTKQRKRDGEVALAREMLANAVKSLSEGFALYDEDHRLVMCNRLYREMNHPVADLIKPGMKWMDMLRESVRRGMYADAVGREEMAQRSYPNRAKFQSRYEADLGNGNWHSVSMHSTDLGGFVVREPTSASAKKAEAAESEATVLLQKVLDACPAPTQMSSIDGQTLYRNPASRELYGDRPQTRRTTMSTRTIEIR